MEYRTRSTIVNKLFQGLPYCGSYRRIDLHEPFLSASSSTNPKPNWIIANGDGESMIDWGRVPINKGNGRGYGLYYDGNGKSYRSFVKYSVQNNLYACFEFHLKHETGIYWSSNDRKCWRDF